VRKAAAKFPELCSPAAKIGWLISYYNRTVGTLPVDTIRKHEIERQDLSYLPKNQWPSAEGEDMPMMAAHVHANRELPRLCFVNRERT
jgi:hypothetical protein